MLSPHTYCVILAGGTETKFWPLSRESRPKPFLGLIPGGKTFLRHTWDRVTRFVPESNILVVTLRKYKDLVQESIPGIPEANILCEPYGRNTAPSLAYAAYTLLSRDPDAVMISTPADLSISDEVSLMEILQMASSYASGHSRLITLGIVPTSANTNFGYIQMTPGAVAKDEPAGVKTFTEKPDPDLAEVFVQSGEFLWNSGIFIWKASAIIAEMEKHCPEITRLWTGWEKALGSDAEKEFIEKVYTDSPNISIDYAVMEKSDNTGVYPADFGWADLGTWNSLYECMKTRDGADNCVITAGKTIIKNGSGNILCSRRDGKLVVIDGLSDYIVVDTDDVLVVCPRGQGAIKAIVSETSMPEFEKYK